MRFDGDPAAAGAPTARSRGRRGRLRQPRPGRGDAHRDRRLREGAPAVRQAHRLVPGRQARLRRHARGIAVSRQLVGAAVASHRRATDRMPTWPRRWRRRTPAAPPSTSSARPCNCTVASATRGRAASTSTSSGPRSIVRCSALPQRIAKNSLNVIYKEIKEFRMGVPVYKRILDLFEAEGINTLFGIPDPNFVHMFTEADARGWSVVAPHHELSAGLHGRGGLPDDRQAGPVHRHARPGRGQHRRSDDVRPGGELTGDLPRRPASPRHRAPGAPRPDPIRPAGGPFRAVGQVQQLHRVRRPDRRDHPRGHPPGDVRHPRPVLRRVPVARDPRGTRCR